MFQMKFKREDEEGAGAAGGGAVDDSWKGTLPDSVKDWNEVKEAKSADSFWEQMQNMRSFMGQSIRVPGEDASKDDKAAFNTKLMEKVPSLMQKPDFDNDEVMQAFYSQMGRPEEAEVYDLKTHKAFGRVREFTTQVRRNRASFFALLPKPAPRPQLTLQAQTAALGDIVSGAIHIPKADGLHAVRITATAPDGSRATWFRRDLLVDKKSQAFDFPIAYNDAIGEWTLRATDLYTNQEITERITVERP